ncbi:MAG: NAD(P)/FAD-dependent oxidoreductase [Mogibacterium sp.]|nr:NAD(P)/FAD-dependent oxidoreductase [Mogibacterium sp.]
MVRTDVIIIGAGLLGCFTARNLMRYEADVIVLEKEQDVCHGISKANTGIIYSGYNNSFGSEKQKLCVQANEDFDRLCNELEVPFRRPGSLMIGYGPKADSVIARKYSDGLKGGVKGLRMLSGEEAEAMEPALAKGITSALYSSETGTVDPWDLCIAAYENARNNGARFMFGQQVTSIRREKGGFTVETDKEIFFAASVVNAAGLSSDTVRELTEQPRVRLFPSSADYIVLDRQAGAAVEHIILHEGEDGKGLTLVQTVDGNLLIGPTNRDSSAEEASACDMRTDRMGLESLEELCAEIVPDIDLAQKIRSFGSLRPNPYYVKTECGRAVREDRSIKDIQIMEERGLFSLIGIKTPGLTFSNELGRIVADKAAAYAGRTMLNADFDPCRKAIIRARDLSLEERAAVIEKDPDYGEVLCSCMDVTLSEVKQAVKRGAYDFESVKRRTGAGFGKCQGSRCRRRIMDIIKSEDRQ